MLHRLSTSTQLVISHNEHKPDHRQQQTADNNQVHVHRLGKWFYVEGAVSLTLQVAAQDVTAMTACRLEPRKRFQVKLHLAEMLVNAACSSLLGVKKRTKLHVTITARKLRRIKACAQTHLCVTRGDKTKLCV